MSEQSPGVPRRRPSHDDNGFTLVELLIVIIVLGVLAAVTVLGLSNITGQSLTSACHADAKSVAVAIEAYRAQNDVLPTTVQNLVTPPAGINGGPFLRSLPGNTTKYVISTDGAGHVLVANLTKGAPAVDFENPGATGDPCAGL